MLRWASGIPTETVCRTPARAAIRANSRYGGVVAVVVDHDGLAGLGRVQAGTEPELVLPLVQVHRQRAGEDHAPRPPVLDHRQRHVLDSVEGLLGQLGHPTQRLLGRVGRPR